MVVFEAKAQICLSHVPRYVCRESETQQEHVAPDPGTEDPSPQGLGAQAPVFVVVSPMYLGMFVSDASSSRRSYRESDM